MSHKRKPAKRHIHHPKHPKQHRKTASSSESASTAAAPQHQVSTEERRKMIATAAYFRAAGRGFSDGDPVADWLAAEREIQERLGA